MTPHQVYTARITLAKLAGLEKFTAAEFARLLRLKGATGGETVLDWEGGKREISGPASLAIDLMLKHGLPNDWRECLKNNPKRKTIYDIE